MLEPCNGETVELVDLVFADMTISRDPTAAQFLSLNVYESFSFRFLDPTYFDTSRVIDLLDDESYKPCGDLIVIETSSIPSLSSESSFTDYKTFRLN